MQNLKFILIFTGFCIFFNLKIQAQVDPENPPDDGSGTELGVPLHGKDIFYLVALSLGGIVILGQVKKSKTTERK
jgi:hypothetical protein